MKRICIYITYDFENIVDDYIGYMLQELQKEVDHLVVVCNYEYIVCGIDNIQAYADKIYYRKNVGFDAGAFKDTLCNFLGWDEILKYDELVLLNDSFFGPFTSFQSIFIEMENRQNDFWGLTMQAETLNLRKLFDSKIPEHIQSFFIAVQSKMLHSSVFRQYWEELPYFNNFDDVINYYELQFTQYFKRKGFSYSVYADTKINDSTKKENNYSQYAMISYELIKKRNFPFLKKQQIAYNTLDSQTQENLRYAIDYIENNTKYDVNLIWKNIIRTMNVSDLQHSLHLQYIFSGEDIACIQHYDIVIAVSANYLNAAEYVIEYLSSLKLLYKIKIYTIYDEIFDYYCRYGYDCSKESLDSCEEIEKLNKYKYVCVIHDVDMSSDNVPSYINKSLFYNLWGNMLINKYFVERIISKFEVEHALGFLAPPLPNFGSYFGELGKEWNKQYVECRKIIQNKEIHCIISENKPPFTVTENYWIRGEVLCNVSRLGDIDFEMMKYFWIFLVQEKGYYSGIVESIDYASMNEVNKQYYLHQISKEVYRLFGDFKTLFEFNKLVFGAALRNFCYGYTRIYIYGTGYMAEQYKDLVPQIDGYIVSDGQPNERNKEGIPILYLSEIAVDKDVGVIVCVSEKLQGQIIAQLKRKGINNYICI